MSDRRDQDQAAAPESPPDSLAPAAADRSGDPGHWLYRLSAEEWLRAAENELVSAERSLDAKQQRAGVTYARRAAGMALNACLCVAFDPAYGRSYMDHLHALAKDDAASAELREAAARLVALPLTQQLVTLGPRGDRKPAELAARILGYARQVVLHRAAPATS
jgi:HEPN domain-containing protein